MVEELKQQQIDRLLAQQAEYLKAAVEAQHLMKLYQLEGKLERQIEQTNRLRQDYVKKAIQCAERIRKIENPPKNPMEKWLS